jgi:hypothetical protein
VMFGVPFVNPVPTGCSMYTTSDTVVHAFGFATGPDVPGCHEIGPFSSRKPSSELQPGPPLSLRA